MAYTEIDDPSAFFQTTLYTGNGGTQSITNTGNSDLQPDFVWVKERNGATKHYLFDSVRGVEKSLHSHSADDELDNSNTLTAFNSDGFSIGNLGEMNTSSDTYVAWQWKAGTSFTNDASSTSVGTIDSAGSINTTAGIAIISYTATGSAETIAHGLGTTPGLIITKRRNGSDSWFFWNDTFSATQYLSMDTTNAVLTASTVFGTLPTSTVYSTGGGGGTGTDGGTYISYVFAEKQGFSKFGKYTVSSGENNFIYLGFKPAFLIVKQTETGGNVNWGMFDNKRPGFNNANSFIYANTNAAEDTSNSHTIDFVSNGLRLRANTVGVNPGKDYIYWAVAAEPFVSSGGVPATAR